MKLNKINPSYIFAGVVLLAVVGYYSMPNVDKVDNTLLPAASEQEETTEDTTAPVGEEKKTEPVVPTSTHVNCTTNDWDCFVKAATDGNTATMVSYMDDSQTEDGMINMDITTKLEITDVASNSDVTLSQKKTKVDDIRYTEGDENPFGNASDASEYLQMVKEYLQKQVGLARVGVYTYESFLLSVNEWKNNREPSMGGKPSAPYKVLKDEVWEAFLGEE